MADKFTRLGLVEGDIGYATTASSVKSIESLEDNIDNKLTTYIGSDTTGGSIASSVTETKIGEVIIPASSVNRDLIIIAGVRNAHSGGGNNSTFRIRTGTSATATSNTQRASILLTVGDSVTAAAGAGTNGGVIMARITSSQETLTGQIYVHVTGENSANHANAISYCDFIYVLGS